MEKTGNSNLWNTAISTDTLAAAWEKVRINRGAAGADHVTVDAYGINAGRRIALLSRRLTEGTYERGPFRHFNIPKRKGGFRHLTVPTVEDRIVDTAIALTLAPVLEPQFEESSFAYRPGRSVKQAVVAIEKWRDAGYMHVIDADIIDYFDAVRHSTLLEALRKALNGCAGAVPILNFVRASLENQGASLGTPGRGLVQGSPLSPLLANLYLDVLDEQIAGHGVRIVRFADDFVVLCKKKHNAEIALAKVQSVLATLGLKLHPQNTQIVDFDRGFQFLGYLFVRSLAMESHQDGFTGDREPHGPMRTEHSAPTGAALTEAKVESSGPVRDDGYSRGARILYVMERGRQIVMRNDSFSILDKDGSEITALAHRRVDRIEVGPDVSANIDVLEHCLSYGTALAFINGHGEARGSLTAGKDQSAALQIAQAKVCLDRTACQKVARSFVEARIRNQRTQLFRLNRRQTNDQVSMALDRMGRHLRKLSDTMSVAQLRGIEGVASTEYWPALGLLCDGAQTPFRRTRPATDPLNAVINYLAAILERDTRGALQSAGLHIGFGTLHAWNDYSHAAVYDFMEPFRAALTEGLAVFLFNSKRLRADMFENLDDGGIHITSAARAAVIAGYEQAAAKRITVPGGSRRLAWRRMMRRQAADYANAIRGNSLESFRPYLMEA